MCLLGKSLTVEQRCQLYLRTQAPSALICSEFLSRVQSQEFRTCFLRLRWGLWIWTGTAGDCGPQGLWSPRTMTAPGSASSVQGPIDPPGALGFQGSVLPELQQGLDARGWIGDRAGVFVLMGVMVFHPAVSQGHSQHHKPPGASGYVWM